MAVTEYLRIVASSDGLGDLDLKTQHLLGATRWERVSETEVIGHHQIQMALQKGQRSGSSHATYEHYYKRIGEDWKLAGVKPRVWWSKGGLGGVLQGRPVDGEMRVNGVNGQIRTANGREDCEIVFEEGSADINWLPYVIPNESL